jgi:hypothetical protein
MRNCRLLTDSQTANRSSGFNLCAFVFTVDFNVLRLGHRPRLDWGRTQAPIERLDVSGFRFGAPEAELLPLHLR